MVLSQGDCAHTGTFGNVWRHFWLYLVGRDQQRYETSYNAQDSLLSLTTTENYPAQI